MNLCNVSLCGSHLALPLSGADPPPIRADRERRSVMAVCARDLRVAWAGQVHGELLEGVGGTLRALIGGSRLRNGSLQGRGAALPSCRRHFGSWKNEASFEDSEEETVMMTVIKR